MRSTRKKVTNILAIFLTSIFIFTVFGQSINAAASVPIMTVPENGSTIPYFGTYLKWTDASNEAYYLISIRDLTTNTLVRNRVVVSQNSANYYIGYSDLVASHSYKWSLAAVDSSGAETWNPISFTFDIEDIEPHVASGGFTSATHLDFWVSDGGNTTYGNNILQAGGEMWNNVSSNVYAHRDFNTTAYEAGIIRSTSANTDLFGYAKKFNNGQVLVGDADLTGTWNFVEVYAYENSMVLNNFTDEQKRATVAHEMGHALSLKHTDFDLWTQEIMDSGKDKAKSTTDIDRTHLRIKWGW